MRGLLLAAAVLVTGSATPPQAPPCEASPRLVQPDKPSAAQRYNPGLF